MDVQIKIASFSGEKKDWERWSATFLAKARLKGYRDVIIGTEIVAKGSKGREEYVVKNDVAFAELLISCDSDAVFGIVQTSRSEEHPEGDAHLAWTRLTNKFEPKTKANLIKIKREFTECRLWNCETDPDDWIKDLINLRRKLEILGNSMSELDLIIHILHNLPPEYENTVEILENELENDALYLEKLKDKLRCKFERLNKDGTKGRNEKALVSGFKTKYKGLCTNCGKYGHRGRDCKGKDYKKPQTKFDEKMNWKILLLLILEALAFTVENQDTELQIAPKGSKRKVQM